MILACYMMIDNANKEKLDFSSSHGWLIWAHFMVCLSAMLPHTSIACDAPQFLIIAIDGLWMCREEMWVLLSNWWALDYGLPPRVLQISFIRYLVDICAVFVQNYPQTFHFSIYLRATWRHWNFVLQSSYMAYLWGFQYHMLESF